MPMLKICTPPPDMYSMNACMGNDLTGEIAKSHAFLVFSSSYEFTAASAVIAAEEGEDGDEEEDEDEGLPVPGAFP